MAIEETTRLGLPTYTSGSDFHPQRSDFNQRMELLDQLAAIVEQGPHADRPLPETMGRLWMSTDTEDLYYDTGSTWVRVVRIGSGGAGEDVVVDGTASEGSSDRAARADHTHNLPLATASAPGAMPAADKAKLDQAGYGGTPDQLVKLDSDGGNRVRSVGTSDWSVANKGYVDGQIGTRAPSSHSHDADDLESGTLAPDRLPAATTSEQGAMPAADKEKLDEASYLSYATLMARDSQGGSQVSNVSSAGYSITNRNYVEQHVDEAISPVSDRLDEAIEYRTTLQSGDLNSIGPGVYHIAGSNVSSVSNTPPANYTIEVVEFPAYPFARLQEAWELDTDGFRCWKRVFRSGNWSTWQEVQFV